MDGADVKNSKMLDCTEGKDFQKTIKSYNRENFWLVKFKYENIKRYEVMIFEEVG